MGLLIELIGVLSRQKLQRMKVLSNPEKKKGKIYELFHGFQSGKFKTEEDAAMHLYQAPPTDARYRKIRNKLKVRLINTLMFIDTNQTFFNEPALARFNCLKLFTAQQILSHYKGGRASTKIVRKVIKEADRYGFLYLALEGARLLRATANLRGDAKSIEENSKKIRTYLKLIEAECKAEEYYQKLAVSFSRSRQIRRELFEENLEKKKSLIPLLKDQDTPLLTYNAYSFFFLIRILDRDYKGAIAECEIALDRLNQGFREVKRPYLFSFSFNILQCHLQLRNYQEGELAVQRCINILGDSVSVYNYFLPRELQLLLNLHTERYENACDLYWKAVNSKRFKELDNSSKETWKIYGAFIQYFIEIGTVKSIENPLQQKKFRIAKFLNEVPTYSKDKRGLNVPILIIQLLFLLHRRKYNEVIDRVESLKTYLYRYLKKDVNYRSNCFLRMLITLPQADFHRQGVIRKASKFYENLLAEPLELSGGASDVEIIPYETLWEFVLDSLEDKFQKYKKPS